MAVFRPLFSLHCEHEYFSGGVCAALELTPTPFCGRLIENAQLLLRSGGGRLTVYVDPDRLGALPDEAQFDFRVRSRDPEFLYYTDGLSPAPGKALYFSSTADGLPGDGRLSRATWASRADHCPEGAVPPDLLADRIPALFPVRIVAGANHPEGISYYLPLRARRTTWHYYVSGPGIAGGQLSVTSPGQEETFEYRGEVDLPGGRRASHFRSRTPLPLLQEQPVHFSLRESHNGRLVVRKLPVPSPRFLGHEDFDGEEVLTSQMFVNL